MEQTKTFENNGQLVCFTNNYALIITGDCLRVVSPNNPYITIEGKHVRESGNLIGNYVGISATFEGKTAEEWAQDSKSKNFELEGLRAKIDWLDETNKKQVLSLEEQQGDLIKENYKLKKDNKEMEAMINGEHVPMSEKSQHDANIIREQSRLIQQQAAELDGLRAEVMELKGKHNNLKEWLKSENITIPANFLM